MVRKFGNYRHFATDRLDIAIQRRDHDVGAALEPGHGVLTDTKRLREISLGPLETPPQCTERQFLEVQFVGARLDFPSLLRRQTVDLLLECTAHFSNSDSNPPINPSAQYAIDIIWIQ